MALAETHRRSKHTTSACVDVWLPKTSPSFKNTHTQKERNSRPKVFKRSPAIAGSVRMRKHINALRNAKYSEMEILKAQWIL